ncbi:MAG: family NAD(P)-dependent oxidoreductase [Nevskia sp.]|nr:family NAD(P)-dependent oxidoreductase [Nevskia sp.]
MNKKWTTADLPRLDGKLALVTGANRGLGFEISTALATAGATVVMACRDTAKATAACQRLRQQVPKARVEPVTLDLASLASVRRFSEAFRARFASLDLLCNNASAIMVPLQKTADGFEMHIGTNHLGHFALTGLLMEILRAAPAARIVNTASIAHRLTPGLDLDDPHFANKPYKEMDAYGKSKLAALLYTFELDRRLRASGSRITAAAAHPGYSATNLDLGSLFMRISTRLFAQAPAMGALPALYAATAHEVQGGDYLGPGGFKELKGHPARANARAEAKDPALATRLWNWSEQLTGVRYLDS